MAADPDGRNLITIVPAGDEHDVATISMAAGAITGRLGPVGDPVFPDVYLASDPTGRYVLTW